MKNKGIIIQSGNDQDGRFTYYECKNNCQFKKEDGRVDPGYEYNESYDIIVPFGSAIKSEMGKSIVVSDNLFETPFTLVVTDNLKIPQLNTIHVGMLKSLVGAGDTVKSLYPGMRISAEGGEGKILTVNGGRVKVDFNHPLAGKDLIYEVEVTEIIEEPEEKIKSMIELHYSNPNVDLDKTEISIEDGIVNIQLDEMAKFDQQSYMDVTFARFRIAKDIWENIEEVTKVNFVDAFEKREETDEEEDEE